MVFVLSFRFKAPKEGIDFYEFPTTNKEWLWFIAQNRREHLATQLKPGIDPRIFSAEIIIGKVANDKVFRVVDMYHSGLWDKERAIKEIKTYPNYDQTAFITQKAIDQLLIFESSEEVKIHE